MTINDDNKTHINLTIDPDIVDFCNEEAKRLYHGKVSPYINRVLREKKNSDTSLLGIESRIQELMEDIKLKELAIAQLQADKEKIVNQSKPIINFDWDDPDIETAIGHAIRILKPKVSQMGDKLSATTMRDYCNTSMRRFNVDKVPLDIFVERVKEKLNIIINDE